MRHRPIIQTQLEVCLRERQSQSAIQSRVDLLSLLPFPPLAAVHIPRSRITAAAQESDTQGTHAASHKYLL